MFVYIFWKNRYFTYRSISDTKDPYKAHMTYRQNGRYPLCPFCCCMNRKKHIEIPSLGECIIIYKALESLKEADFSQIQEASQWVAVYVNSASTRYMAETLRKAKEDTENRYSLKSSFGEGEIIGS